MSTSFELHKTYNFNTLAPSILGTNYRNTKILGIFDYATALKYFVPETTAVSVYPHLPVGTVSDPKKYSYVLIESEAGLHKVLALEWIDRPTITVVSYQTITVTVTNASSGDATKIRDSLLLLGIANFQIAIS